MSIVETDVIDIISTAEDEKSVILTATDHLEWGDNNHLMLIQEKLNTYLAFIESGEIFESYPTSRGKAIEINITCKHPPDDNGQVFLDRCRDIIEEAGFALNYKVYEE